MRRSMKDLIGEGEEQADLQRAAVEIEVDQLEFTQCSDCSCLEISSRSLKFSLSIALS